MNQLLTPLIQSQMELWMRFRYSHFHYGNTEGFICGLTFDKTHLLRYTTPPLSFYWLTLHPQHNDGRVSCKLDAYECSTITCMRQLVSLKCCFQHSRFNLRLSWRRNVAHESDKDQFISYSACSNVRWFLLHTTFGKNKPHSAFIPRNLKVMRY